MSTLDELEGQITDLEAQVAYLTKQASGSARPGSSDPFERAVEAIRKQDNCTRLEALRKARVEAPDAFLAHRGSAPNAFGGDFDQLVEREMLKGITREVAGQRVLMKHGAQPDAAHVRKSQSAAADFMGEVDAVMIAKRCTRTDAMQLVRQRHPDLYAAFREA